MKVLITGSGGCVGSALKAICSNEHDWVFIERKDCNLTERSQTIGLFNEIRPDYVIHLASYVPGFYSIDKIASFSNNIRINENVLEASHLVNVNRVMSCLSTNMFPEVPSKFPMDENMIFEGQLTGPFAGYAYSKRMLELQNQNYNTQYNRKYFGIVPCNIYGPNDNIASGRLIPNLIGKFNDAKKNNTDVIINGAGKPLRQFIYSIDLANIIKHLVSSYSDTKPIICCGNEEVSILELANKISKAFNFTQQIQFDISKPDGNLKKTVSNAYLKTIMPNISFTSLNDGLQKTIDYVETI
jgi:GDP-L-fucose synthase